MLPREILKEYNQEKTAQNFGEKLLLRYFQDLEQNPSSGIDTVTGVPMETWLKISDIDQQLQDSATGAGDSLEPETIQKLETQKKKLKDKTILKILKGIEQADPTNHKEYTQWLVRTYIKDEMSLEDVISTVSEYLNKFNALKIKRHIKPPESDIGSYKTFNDFLNEVDQYQDPFASKEDKAERGKYDVIYDQDNLLILQPKDKTAACFFGRGTRWCTAATIGSNYFSNYNRDGRLNIIIPRKPEKPGEKYQFHFERDAYAHADDTYLTGGEKLALVDRFPQLREVFKQQAEKHGLFWLQKPIVKKGDNYTLNIYKKDNQPYLRLIPNEPEHEGEEYFIGKTSDGNVYMRNGSNDELSTVEEYSIIKRFPELIEKLDLPLNRYDPKGRKETTDDNKEFIRFNRSNVIVRLPDGKRYNISLGYFSDDGEYGSSDEDPRDFHYGRKLSRGVYEYLAPNDNRRRYNNMTEVNPYAFMIQHPEVQPFLSKVLNAVQNDVANPNFRTGDNGSEKYAWMAPYSKTTLAGEDGTASAELFEFGQNSKPIAYYISDFFGEGDPHEEEGDVIAMRADGQTEGIYDVTGAGDYRVLNFTQQMALAEQYPQLKEFLPNSNMFNPKTTQFNDFRLQQFGEQREKRSRHSDDEIIRKYYFVIPNDPKIPGEKYALEIESEERQNRNGETREHVLNIKPTIFHGNAETVYLGRNTSDERSSKETVLASLLYRFPELTQVFQMNEVVKPQRHYGRSSDDITQLMREYDDDRVSIEQYGNFNDREEEADPFSIPSLVVRDKKKNETYVIHFSAKDRRGKAGKIGGIQVKRLSKDLFKKDDEGNVVADVAALDQTNVIRLFRKFPQIIDIIDPKNIHPKTPHPALVKSEGGELEEEFDNFTIIRSPTMKQSNNYYDKNVITEIIEPDDPEYKGQTYLMNIGQGPHSAYNDSVPAKISIQERSDNTRAWSSDVNYNDPQFKDFMKRFPEMQDYFDQLKPQLSSGSIALSTPDKIDDVGNHRVYIWNVKNSEPFIWITPEGDPLWNSPEDEAGSRWFRNGFGLDLTSGDDSGDRRGFGVDGPNKEVIDSDPKLKKYLTNLADSLDTSGINSSVYHLSDTTDTLPDTFNQTPELYKVSKLGSKNPVYNIRWAGIDRENLEKNNSKESWRTSRQSDAELRLRGLLPNISYRYGGGQDESINPELTQLLKDKVIPVAGEKYVDWITTNNILVQPKTGEIKMSINDYGDNSFYRQLPSGAFKVKQGLYNAIPELKKLVPPKKAKQFGWIPEYQKVLKKNIDIRSSGTKYDYVISKWNMPNFSDNIRAGYHGERAKNLGPGELYTLTFRPKSKQLSDKGYPERYDDTQYYIFFPKNKPAIILDRYGDKINLKVDEKKAKFAEIMPELQELLGDYAKKNSWLRENVEGLVNTLLKESELIYEYYDLTTDEEIDPFVDALEEQLNESLGDLAWAKKKAAERQQARKKEWKPNYHFVKPGELRGSYSDQQMKDLGFKMASSGNWYMPEKKFQDLIKSGKLREEVAEGKKYPRTSEFLQIKEIQQLAGITEEKGGYPDGSNISFTADKISKVMKDRNIQPGSDEWFRLWFALPKLTGEKPYDN